MYFCVQVFVQVYSSKHCVLLLRTTQTTSTENRNGKEARMNQTIYRLSRVIGRQFYESAEYRMP